MFQIYPKDPNLIHKLDFSKPINFLIHGWRDGLKGHDMYDRGYEDREYKWMYPLAKEWAQYNNSNVCIVDWSFLAKDEYSRAVFMQTDRVVERFMNFTRKLSKHGMDCNKVSIAGHSLGAHIAGMIGRRVQLLSKELYAIYGLDPAGPMFGTNLLFVNQQLSLSHRLVPTDARYVQCIETSIIGINVRQFACGKANFIMYGGNNQPGCSSSIQCNHAEARHYFRIALNPRNKLIGFEKKDGEIIGWSHSKAFDFEEGSMHIKHPVYSHKAERLGIYANRTSGTFFIDETTKDYRLFVESLKRA